MPNQQNNSFKQSSLLKQLNSLYSFINQQQTLLLALQSGMTALPAIGPDNNGEGEEAKALFLKAQLAGLGLPAVVEINAPDTRVPCGYRPNFYTLLPGKDNSRTIWIVAHIDVVPPGDLSLWKTDPFKLKVEGDLIYGRGVEDNQQAVVSGIIALHALVQNNIQPACNLALLCLSDEETNNLYGAHFVLENAPNLFGPRDVMLVPDFGNPDASMLEVAEKGVLWLKFTVLGKQCHASTPNQGVNSLVAAADLILRLNDLNNPGGEFGATNPLFLPPVSTFTPSRKEANVPNINTMPGRDVFYMDCRLLPGCSSEQVLASVNKLIKAVEQAHGVKVELEIVEKRDPAPPTNPAHPFMQALAQAVQAVYGLTPTPQGIGGNTVAAVFRKKHIACAVWARLVANAHMPNECSRISWSLDDAKVICNLALNYQGCESGGNGGQGKSGENRENCESSENGAQK